MEMLQIPRATYHDIADDHTDWQPLRDELSTGAFIDMQRLMVPGNS